MRKYYCLFTLPAILILLPSCSHTLPITDRPCKQNITVLSDNNTGNISVISGTVTLIENDKDNDPSLSMYLQESGNKYMLSFIYSSFRNSPRPDKAILEFADSSVMELGNPVYNKEMKEGSSNKYTDTFFELNEKQLETLSDKAIMKIGITFIITDQTHPLLTMPDAEKAATIKYLANCFVERTSEVNNK